MELVDEEDSKISSPSVAGVGKSPGKSSVFRILFFICLSHPSCISLQILGDAYPGVKKYICRCVGIGRRGGLKIRWANNSCGFDPRHRHHICSEVLCFGAFFLLLRSIILNIFWKRRKNCICRRDLTGKIQMCVDIGCCADIAVSQPFLNLLQAHTIGIEETGTAMPLRYNNDKRKKPLFSRGLSVCRHLFNSFSKLKCDEKIIEKRRLFH